MTHHRSRSFSFPPSPRRLRGHLTLAGVAVAAGLLGLAPGGAFAWTFGNSSSSCGRFSISHDGRYVSFVSSANNLVANDTNGNSDVFRLDRLDGSVVRVSVNSGENQSTGGTNSDSAISADGTKIAFTSTATNLVANDTNGVEDIFVRDLTAGTTIRVSVSTGGAQGNDPSNAPAISADGTRVAFSSYASNLVAGDTNGTIDIFVRDLTDGSTVRVSVASDESQGNSGSYNPSLNSDGTLVTFESSASNLVASDTNLVSDIFVRNLANGTTQRVSLGASNAQGNGPSTAATISGDGAFVAFVSEATNLVADDTNGVTDVFVRNLAAGTTGRISVSSGEAQGNAASRIPSIDSDGNRVSFVSHATNLVGGDTNSVSDVFVRTRDTGQTFRVSVNSAGVQGNATSNNGGISGNGNFVCFASGANNLVTGDTNSVFDVFVRDLGNSSTSVPVTVSEFAVE